MKLVFAWFVCVVITVLGVTGCSSDSSSGTSGTSGASGTPSGDSTQYKGTFAGKGEGGAIDLSVANASSTVGKSLGDVLAVLQVSGTLKISGGASIPITGTYDDATKAFTISGGGYTFTGTLGATGVTGSYTGPNGGGSFSALAGTGSKAYCGTYSGPSTGVWNFTVNGTTLAGSYSSSKGDGGLLTGTAADGKVEMKYEGGTATGTITGDTATGTYTGGGTWTGKGC